MAKYIDETCIHCAWFLEENDDVYCGRTGFDIIEPEDSNCEYYVERKDWTLATSAEL